MTVWLVQLVFDCADPDEVARFWGRALEYRNDLAHASAEEIAAFRRQHPQFEGRGRVDDRQLRRPPVYIQRVSEPKQGRERVRLEVAVPPGGRAAAVNELRSLGATGQDELRDVEGNEFSVVEEKGLTERRLRSVVFDALDPDRLLRFWSEATGYPPSEGRCDPPAEGPSWGDGAFLVEGRRYLHVTGMEAEPATGGRLFDLTPGLAFLAADSPKARKNRLHLDLNSTDAESDRRRLVRLGATVLRWDTDHVMADPEGNEFCLSPSRVA
ncbi:MAG TPA: VOC family protein [Acidimicrobiales bacterium]|nr:VOC family protein [Acidimicrobiales bacterium]